MESVKVPVTPIIVNGAQTFESWAKKNKLKVALDESSFIRPLGRMRKEANLFEASLAASNSRVLAFGTSVAVLNSVSTAMRSVVKSTIEVEKALIDINRILSISESSLQKFGSSLFEIAKETSTSFQDVSKAALEFSRQGLSVNDVLSRTSETLKLVRLTGLDAAKAVELLTATVNAFDGLKIVDIVNKFVAVESQFAVSARDLVEGLSRVGSSAVDAKIDLNELNAMITSVQQTTGRGGPVIGNALKTIFTRLQRTDTLEALNEFDIAIRDIKGNILPASMILQEFAATYESLADSTKSYLREQVAGVYQGNILSAILKDLSKQQNVYQRALEASKTATTQADVANEALQKSFSSLLTQTSVELSRFGKNVGKFAFEPIASNIAEAVKGGISLANENVEDEGISIGRGFLKGLGNILTGPGLALSFLVIGKAAKNMFEFTKDAIPSLLGVVTLKEKQKQTEEYILNLMRSQDGIAEELLNSGKGSKIIAQDLLENARRITEQKEKELDIAKKLAAEISPKIGSTSITPTGILQPGAIKRKDIPGAASGYLPPIKKESENIKKGIGGASKDSFPVLIKDFPFGSGKRGPIVANSSEFIIPNYDKKGGAAIFNQKMIKDMGLPSGAIPVAAEGYDDEGDLIESPQRSRDKRSAEDRAREEGIKHRMENMFGKIEDYSEIEKKINKQVVEAKKIEPPTVKESQASSEVKPSVKAKVPSKKEAKPKVKLKTKKEELKNLKEQAELLLKQASAEPGSIGKIETEYQKIINSLQKLKAPYKKLAKDFEKLKPKSEAPAETQKKEQKQKKAKEKVQTKKQKQEAKKAEAERKAEELKQQREEAIEEEKAAKAAKAEEEAKAKAKTKAKSKRKTKSKKEAEVAAEASVEAKAEVKTKAKGKGKGKGKGKTKAKKEAEVVAGAPVEVEDKSLTEDEAEIKKIIEQHNARFPDRPLSEQSAKMMLKMKRDQEMIAKQRKEEKAKKEQKAAAESVVSEPVYNDDFDDDDFEVDVDYEGDSSIEDTFGTVEEQQNQKREQINKLISEVESNKKSEEDAVKEIDKILAKSGNKEEGIFSEKEATKIKTNALNQFTEKYRKKIQESLSQEGEFGKLIEKIASDQGSESEFFDKMKESEDFKKIEQINPELAKTLTEQASQTIEGKRKEKGRSYVFGDIDQMGIEEKVKTGQLTQEQAIEEAKKYEQYLTDTEKTKIGKQIRSSTPKTSAEPKPKKENIKAIREAVEEKFYSEILPSISKEAGGLTATQAQRQLEQLEGYEELTPFKKQDLSRRITSRENELYTELQKDIEKEEREALNKAKIQLEKFLKGQGGLYSKIDAKTIQNPIQELQNLQQYRTLQEKDPKEAQKQLLDLQAKMKSAKKTELSESMQRIIGTQKITPGKSPQLEQDFNRLEAELRKLGGATEKLKTSFQTAVKAAEDLEKREKAKSDLSKARKDFSKELDDMVQAISQGNKRLVDASKEVEKALSAKIIKTDESTAAKKRLSEAQFDYLYSNYTQEDAEKKVFNDPSSFKDLSATLYDAAQTHELNTEQTRKLSSQYKLWGQSIKDARTMMDIEFDVALSKAVDELRENTKTLNQAQNAINDFINTQDKLNDENKRLLRAKAKERLESASEVKAIADNKSGGISVGTGLALSTLLPMAAGFVQEYISEGKERYQLSEGQRIVERTAGLGSSFGATGAAIGGIYGTQFGIIGGVVGALAGFTIAVATAGKSLDEMVKSLEDFKNKTKENEDIVKERIKLINELNDGEKKTKLEQLQLTVDLNENLLKIKDEDLQEKLRKAEIGSIDALNKALEEYSSERAIKQAAAQAALGLKAFKYQDYEVGFRADMAGGQTTFQRTAYGAASKISLAKTVIPAFKVISEKYTEEQIKEIEKAGRSNQMDKVVSAFRKVGNLSFEQAQNLERELNNAFGGKRRLFKQFFGSFGELLELSAKQDPTSKPEALRDSFEKIKKQLDETTKNMLLASDELERVNKLSGFLYESFSETASGLEISRGPKNKMNFLKQTQELNFARQQQNRQLIQQNSSNLIDLIEKTFVPGKEQIQFGRDFSNSFIANPKKALADLKKYTAEQEGTSSIQSREDLKALNNLIFELTRQIKIQESNYSDELVLIRLRQGIENQKAENIQKELELNREIEKNQLTRKKDSISEIGEKNRSLEVTRFISSNLSNLPGLSFAQTQKIRDAATTKSFQTQRQISEKDFNERRKQLEESFRIEEQKIISDIKLLKSNYDLIGSIKELTYSIQRTKISSDISSNSVKAAEYDAKGQPEEAAKYRAKNNELIQQLKDLEKQYGSYAEAQRSNIDQEIKNLQELLLSKEETNKLQKEIIDKEEKNEELSSKQAEALERISNNLSDRSEILNKSISKLEDQFKLKNLKLEMGFMEEKALLDSSISKNEFEASKISASPYLTTREKAKKRLDIAEKIDKDRLALIEKDYALKIEQFKQQSELDMIKLRQENNLIKSNIELTEATNTLSDATQGLLDLIKENLDIGVESSSSSTPSSSSGLPSLNSSSDQLKRRQELIDLEIEKLELERKITIDAYKQSSEQNKYQDKQAAKKKTFAEGLGEGFTSIRQEVDEFEYTMGQRIPISFRDNMAQALTEIGDKTKSISESLRDAGIAFLTEIRNAFAKQSVGNIMTGASTFFQNRSSIKAQNGMYISGSRTGDRNPALLEDGEYVLNRNAVRAMGGPAALDRLNFSMAPRFASGGYASLNEPIDSKRFSGFFYQSSNVELSEKRSAAEAAFRERLQKQAEKEAKSKQLQQLIASVAVSSAMAVGSNYVKTAIQNRAIVQNTPAYRGPLKYDNDKQTQDFGYRFFERIRNEDIQNTPTYRGPWAYDEQTQDFRNNQYANGGYINKGFANKDSIPMFAAGGEYMLNSKAVRKYGVPYLERLNGGYIPAYQNGGAVSDGNLGSQSTQNYKTEITINMNGDSSVNASGDGVSDADKQKELGKKIESAVRKVIQEEQRTTGLLSRKGRRL